MCKKNIFDNLIFKNNLFLKWCDQIVIFVGLTSTENVQKDFQFNSWSGLLASFWKDFIKLRWHGQKFTFVIVVIQTKTMKVH